VAAASLLACALPAAVRGQQASDPGHFTLAFTAGRHFLGIEAGVSPVRRLALVGLAEGGFANRSVHGVGLRFDPHVERSGRVYARVLYGSMRCTTPWDVFTCSRAAEEWRGAWSPGAGIELRLRDTGIAWLGLDVSRWIAIDRDALGREIEHFAAAAVLRLRM
jgi:hypothetical protein